MWSQNALLAARELLFELSEQAAIAAAASAPVAAAMAADDTTNPQLAAAAEAAAQGDAMSDELRTALDNTIRLEMEVSVHPLQPASHSIIALPPAKTVSS